MTASKVAMGLVKMKKILLVKSVIEDPSPIPSLLRRALLKLSLVARSAISSVVAISKQMVQSLFWGAPSPIASLTALLMDFTSQFSVKVSTLSWSQTLILGFLSLALPSSGTITCWPLLSSAPLRYLDMRTEPGKIESQFQLTCRNSFVGLLQLIPSKRHVCPAAHPNADSLWKSQVGMLGDVWNWSSLVCTSSGTSRRRPFPRTTENPSPLSRGDSLFIAYPNVSPSRKASLNRTNCRGDRSGIGGGSYGFIVSFLGGGVQIGGAGLVHVGPYIGLGLLVQVGPQIGFGRSDQSDGGGGGGGGGGGAETQVCFPSERVSIQPQLHDRHQPVFELYVQQLGLTGWHLPLGPKQWRLEHLTHLNPSNCLQLGSELGATTPGRHLPSLSPQPAQQERQAPVRVSQLLQVGSTARQVLFVPMQYLTLQDVHAPDGLVAAHPSLRANACEREVGNTKRRTSNTRVSFACIGLLNNYNHISADFNKSCIIQQLNPQYLSEGMGLHLITNPHFGNTSALISLFPIRTLHQITCLFIVTLFMRQQNLAPSGSVEKAASSLSALDHYSYFNNAISAMEKQIYEEHAAINYQQSGVAHQLYAYPRLTEAKLSLPKYNSLTDSLIRTSLGCEEKLAKSYMQILENPAKREEEARRQRGEEARKKYSEANRHRDLLANSKPFMNNVRFALQRPVIDNEHEAYLKTQLIFLEQPRASTSTNTREYFDRHTDIIARKINELGGMEDTIGRMEDSLSKNEVKSFKKKQVLAAMSAERRGLFSPRKQGVGKEGRLRESWVNRSREMRESFIAKLQIQ